jgi:hypothetical protein
MIPALAFVGGAATMWGALWFIEWLLFAPINPIEPARQPRELGPNGYGYGDSL